MAEFIRYVEQSLIISYEIGTRETQITDTRYTLINFHLPFTDTCAPFQTHFLVRVKASEHPSEDLARRAGGSCTKTHFVEN